VEAAEEDDLAVEGVGLDAADAALEALPRRTAAHRAAADRPDLELFGAPLTVFVVRDVVGKCGCSLGPFGDYVTVDAEGLGGRTRRILAHELGHSCGLRHKRDERNLMRPKGPGEELTAWQTAVFRSSRHVTYL